MKRLFYSMVCVSVVLMSVQIVSAQDASPSAEVASESAEVVTPTVTPTEKPVPTSLPTDSPKPTEALQISAPTVQFAKQASIKTKLNALSDAMQALDTPNQITKNIRLAQQDDPDKRIIIGVDLKNVDDDSANKLLSVLAEERKKGSSMQYMPAERLKGFFVSIRSNSSKVNTLKKELEETNAIIVSQDRIYKPAYSPNDPYYSQQTYLTTIKYSQAIDVGVGSGQTIIGIMDNGVNVDTTDLSANIWQNTAETYGDGIDNDSNGYIDDRFGCNFYERWGLSNLSGACTKAEITDGGNQIIHGSYVAGTAAAATNNGIGMAGICPTCKIMVLDIADNDTSGASITGIVKALEYAADYGVKVVNFSYASTCPFDSSQDVLSSTINTAVNTDGIAFVQAAGNAGSMGQADCIASCGSGNGYCSSEARNQAYYYVDGKSVTNKITVASINNSSARSSFSTYDPTSGGNQVITIAAPGENLKMYDGAGEFGTSFSSPVVAGSLGLLLTRYDMSTANQVSRLTSTADAITTDKNISGKKLNLYHLMSPSKWTFEGIAYYVYIPPDQAGKIPVYRFRNEQYGVHFYTASEEEKQNTISNYADRFIYEGIAFYVYTDPASDRVPVYRFRDESLGVHFYTASEAEKTNTINTLGYKWKYEGIAYYVYIPPDQAGKTPVYRFVDRTLGVHFYTASEDERDSL